MTTPKETWTITFQDMPDPLNRPMAIRIRQLLKIALRGCHLRCVDYSTSDRLTLSNQAEQDAEPMDV